MKKYCLALMLGLVGNSVIAQGVQLEWATSSGGASNLEFGNEIAVDLQGNVYTTGSFSQIADFDPGPGVFELESNGHLDIFVQKLDSEGQLVWAKSMGGSDYDTGFSITVDESGNVYTTGIFTMQADFQSGPGTHNITGDGFTNMFVQKLDPNGNLLWVHSFGSEINYSRAIILDENENIYLTGSFIGTTDFDPGTGTTSLTAEGHDVFVLKLDTDGNFVWVKAFGGPLSEEGYDLVRDSGGHIYVAGRYEDTVDFDPGTGVFEMISNGGWDAFVVKLDPSGNFLWAKSEGGLGYDNINAIDVDDNDEIYIAGEFADTVDFDPNSGVLEVISNGLSDGFVQKLDAQGNHIWLKRIGGVGLDDYRSVNIGANGEIYTCGVFSNTVDFESGLNTTNLTSNGMWDVFIEKMNATGDLIWVEGFGGIENDRGLTTIDSLGNMYVSGFYTNTVDFDPGSGVNSLTSAGYEDIFVCKFSGCETYSVDTHVVNGPFTWINGETYMVSTNEPKDTLTNIEGCDSIVSLDLTVNGLNLGIVVDGGSLTSESVGVEYQWLDCDNNYSAIPGATERVYFPETNGNYAVELTTIVEVDTSACVLISNVGIEQNDPFKHVSIYPNPTSGLINLDLGEIHKVTVLLFDVYGKQIQKEQHVNTSYIQIELPEQNGIYLLDVLTDAGRKTYKVLRSVK